MTFGEKLQSLRAREGLSQDALAEALDVSRQAVSMGMSLASSPTQYTWSMEIPSRDARRRTMPPLLAPLAVISSSVWPEKISS